MIFDLCLFVTGEATTENYTYRHTRSRQDALPIYNFCKTRGLPASKQQQCLIDKTALEKLAAIRGDAVKTYKLTGTPTFVLNGVTQENVFDWKGLQPKLDAALN